MNLKVNSQSEGNIMKPVDNRVNEVTVKNMSSLRSSNHFKKLISNIACYFILSIFAITMLLPLIWMVTVALKSSSTVFVAPPEWIPKEFVWYNFVEGTEKIDFWRRALNTFIIAVLCTIGQVISCLSVSYAIARIKFPGRRLWFYLIIGSMMLPGFVSLVPTFQIFSALGMYNTWLPLIIPSFLGAPFYTFLLRQFFYTIPLSFDEAARIDGANHLQILLKVLVPLCKPAIAVIVIMQMQASWNDYLNPLIYLIDPNKWTLSLAMGQYISQYATAWNLFMAADLIYMSPMLILFFVAQKYFMQGLGSLNNAALK